MIKSEKGTVEIDGEGIEIVADLACILRGFKMKYPEHLERALFICTPENLQKLEEEYDEQA